MLRLEAGLLDLIAPVHAAAAETLSGVLRLLDRGIILADAAAHIAYANPAAERILARRDGLSVDRGGALVAARPAETNRLRRLVAAATADAGKRVMAGGVLPLARLNGGRPYVARVAPLVAETQLASCHADPLPPQEQWSWCAIRTVSARRRRISCGTPTASPGRRRPWWPDWRKVSA